MTLTASRYLNFSAIACTWVVVCGCLMPASNAATFQDIEVIEVQDAVGGVIMAAPAAAWEGNTQSKKYIQAVKKLDVILELQMEVDVLRSVCGIDDAQARKLNIAAKAVAQKQMEKWSDRMDDFQMWESFGVQKDKEEEEENVRVEDIDLDKVSSDVLQWLSTDFTGEIGAKPQKHKIWKKALKSALNDEQREKLTAYHSAKKKRQLDANVEFYANMYGSQLMLNDKQHESFSKVIREKLAEQEIALSLDNSYQTIVILASLKKDELDEFMNKKQLQRWRILMGPYTNQFMWQEELVEEVEDAQEDDN